MRNELNLNCIGCGHNIALNGDVYLDYDGHIKCNACAAILSIRIEDGKIKTMNFVKFAKPDVEERFQRR